MVQSWYNLVGLVVESILRRWLEIPLCWRFERTSAGIAVVEESRGGTPLWLLSVWLQIRWEVRHTLHSHMTVWHVTAAFQLAKLLFTEWLIVILWGLNLLRRIAQIYVELLARYWNGSFVIFSDEGLSFWVQLSFRLLIRAFVGTTVRYRLQIKLLEHVAFDYDRHGWLHWRESNKHL